MRHVAAGLPLKTNLLTPETAARLDFVSLDAGRSLPRAALAAFPFSGLANVVAFVRDQAMALLLLFFFSPGVGRQEGVRSMLEKDISKAYRKKALEIASEIRDPRLERRSSARKLKEEIAQIRTMLHSKVPTENVDKGKVIKVSWEKMGEDYTCERRETCLASLVRLNMPPSNFESPSTPMATVTKLNLKAETGDRHGRETENDAEHSEAAAAATRRF
ncbi:hypothetical protein HAX54_032251 [Datura stramonium]|uniref:Uncharacterized protein n=1 Tax=Datura stramonium TaxID=4076 RepID=A0ABS8RLC8_DATST|nr:hypothetical protein [Datura stramonium]